MTVLELALAVGVDLSLSIALILAGLLLVVALERHKRHPPPGTAR
jgi:hypothetical protein